jgi:two-component system response regulator YesN
MPKADKEAGLSRFYFSRLFKAAAGRSFRDHVMMLRIEKSKAVMNDLNLNLSEVAYMCDYENLSSFTRTFKNLTGINPGKYRILNLKIS